MDTCISRQLRYVKWPRVEQQARGRVLDKWTFVIYCVFIMPQRSTAALVLIERPWESAGIFLIVFFILSVFLFLIDFVPEPPHAAIANESVAYGEPVVTLSEVSRVRAENLTLIAGPAAAPVAQAVSVQSGTLPTRIVIPDIGVDTKVLNPATTNVIELDQVLLGGAARYPGTATLDQEGSVLIFGHQSYLPVVRNQAFKALNDVQNLDAGDIVSVYAGSTEYRYAVRSVTLVTTDIGSIGLETRGKTLTLVTCNSLGAKEERYIVKADFIGIYN